MVAPFPSSEEENANLYMYKASVVDATPGPPQVVIKACSKDFRHPVKQKIKQISSTGLIWGKNNMPGKLPAVYSVNKGAFNNLIGN